MKYSSLFMCVVAVLAHAAHAKEPELTSLLGKKLYSIPAGEKRKELEDNLAEARAALEENPDDPDRIVWVGRRLGYLWQMNDAIKVYTEGIAEHPDYAPLYRHRGHRYISIRQFDQAIRDLKRAADLINGKPDVVEPDGMPNEKNIPLTTTAFNVWYHLGLAHYLKGDFENALKAYRETMKYSRKYEDNLVATTDWMVMTLRRLGRKNEAKALLEPIHADMDIIENHGYHRRLLIYKRLLKPDELLTDDAGDLDLATRGYGVGNWFLTNGDAQRAREIFQKVVSGNYWPAFGYIAAEVELARGVESEE